jgi:hypothetical protein
MQMELPLAQFTTPNPMFQWVLIATAIVTIFYAVVRPAMRKKRDPLGKPVSFSALGHERNVERQMQNLLVELSEMARQISAQLDTRSQKLEMLIQHADERIAALKQIPQQHPPQKAFEAPVQRTWTEPAPSMTRNIPIPEPTPDPVEQPHQAVYALADQGKNAAEIARELDRPRGEVELILALRPAGQRA